MKVYIKNIAAGLLGAGLMAGGSFIVNAEPDTYSKEGDQLKVSKTTEQLIDVNDLVGQLADATGELEAMSDQCSTRITVLQEKKANLETLVNEAAKLGLEPTQSPVSDADIIEDSGVTR